ncbi:hypothetical protein [Streptomyces sp. NPDC001809]
MDVPLWQTPSGSVLHLSAECGAFRVPPQRADVSLRVSDRGSMADVPEPGGCQRCPNPFPEYYTQARRLISGMEELATLADRLASRHDLEAYCAVLTFGMFGPRESNTWDIHRLLRKPRSALDSARDRLAEHHADAYRDGKAQ